MVETAHPNGIFMRLANKAGNLDFFIAACKFVHAKIQVCVHASFAYATSQRAVLRVVWMHKYCDCTHHLNMQVFSCKELSKSGYMGQFCALGANGCLCRKACVCMFTHMCAKIEAMF